MSARDASETFRWLQNGLGNPRPSRAARALRPPRRIVVAPEGNGFRANLEAGGEPVAIAALGDGAIPNVQNLIAVLHALPADLKRLPIGLRLPLRAAYSRVIELPAAARKEFGAMLAIDLERSTPLRSAEVMSVHFVEGPAERRGMVRVSQHLLKRSKVEPVLQLLRDSGIEPAFVECDQLRDRVGHSVNFLEDARRTVEMRHARTNRRLITCVALIAAAAAGSNWYRLEAAYASAAAELAALEQAAAEGRQAASLGNSVRLEVEKVRQVTANRPPVTRILEELSRITPDSAWLDELRIDGDTIEIAGAASSAGVLLTFLEGSQLFHRAHFAAPLRRDAADAKERFRLRIEIRGAVAALREARDGEAAR